MVPGRVLLHAGIYVMPHGSWAERGGCPVSGVGGVRLQWGLFTASMNHVTIKNYTVCRGFDRHLLRLPVSRIEWLVGLRVQKG